MQQHPVLRVAALAAVAAVVVALALALLEPDPSHPAEGPDAASAAPAPGVDRPPKTIVMVVFDELPLVSLLGPGERIDAKRYPVFARLAREANWYRGATAVHDSTALAVPAMLDGRYPRRGLRSDVYSHPQNLFTLLAHRYEVNASEEATGLCPTSLCDPLEGTAQSHLGGGKVRRMREFIRTIRPRARPTLWFKHVLLPHVPWQFYPSGRHYRLHAPEPIPDLNGEIGFGVPWLVKVSYQRHLLQLGLADRMLGELLARVRRLGLYDDALVVVAADHGIGFHTGVERRTVTPDNVEDLAPVPLIVKLPGQRRGRVIDRHVETIDVFPTILDLAEVAPPPGLDGGSLLGPVASQTDRVTVFHRVGTELNSLGGHYTFDPRELALRRAAAVRRKLRWFGSGDGRDAPSVYRIGPHRKLLGRPVRSLPHVPGVATAEIHQAEELRHVDTSSGFLPGEITGTVPDGRPGGGRAIALALDGRIVAMGRTFTLEGSQDENFEVIVPESAFHSGAMDARVYEIVESEAGERDSGPALRPL
ncbi:MAG TPA: sulfatase-like hydrolase/transferase [Thermoleophilaceae bacterium]|nr:sulfatase-like hydrolase/transferase [Thermoleophilaceae bacterium]